MNIFIVIIFILVLLLIATKYSIAVEDREHFYDITPYEAHWRIFKCYTPKCIRDRGYQCYEWCKNISEEGARENCRMRCGDYSDEQFDYYKWQSYDFSKINNLFTKYTILNDTDDYVMMTTKLTQ